MLQPRISFSKAFETVHYCIGVNEASLYHGYQTHMQQFYRQFLRVSIMPIKEFFYTTVIHPKG